MSYQVLARKWRPQNFKQMVGQEHVLKALIHALESQRLHHAYLFTGTRGVGKTTIGRILAKCLSCHQGITAEPCGQCGACTSITEGRYVDLIEIDAASRTKVEDMRELLENVQYAPSEGRFKIYLIDEVHMLSQSSFNALLKTLEEPPEHVKFLFATTDPQKLPVTILSRCLQFNLKNMSPERIVGHLQNILGQEQVSFEDMALWALARAADGSMRDALSLTDQAIAYGNHALTETGVSAMLGTVDQKKIYRILDCLISRNAAAMLDEIKALAEFSPNYASVLATIAEVLHRVAIEQAVPGACDNSMGDQEHVVSYARKLCAEDVQLFYQVALVSRQDLAITPDPKSGLEMALLRMLAFQLSPSDQLGIDIVTAPVGNEVPVAEEQTVQSAPLENNLSEDESKKKTLLNSEGLNVEGVAQVERAPVETSESTASRLQEPVETQSFAETEQPVTSVVESPVQEPVSEPVPEPDKQSTLRNEEKSPIAESSSQDHVEKSELAADVLSSGWNKQVTQLGLSGMTLNLMLNSVLEENPDGLNLYFEAGHFRLLNPSHEGRIRESLSKEVAQGRNITFFEGLKPEHESPMMWRERVKAEMGEQAKLSVENDPYVQQMIREFDGVLIENSIKALGQII
ncbi:hypothetical protein A3740_00800 [Oleiphilus sp. HI0068]|jgi:DNA polymerase-3 subunit gamma/tau|uniref:DNA polymerase III subunit gamma/tau n=4 Tax=Oleiphilus TaxID=141450 RepID=UPI0007C23BF5|nr:MULTISPECIES: DNA polymerase III subunit gamma/tau [unclassified Oleiphilus]KZY77507.1 hypothetical protein A3741_09585 [Oleiphilus sp. HI0069]KZY79729.1 hypothetical protein A3740_00800 [Oleiphilus sp. HI0068]KZY33926.1 hypothetical protein A3729_05670 [Oleiphilus sp. HI0043]KZZ72571.1 hypothetical protein A3763_09935 [Oleiphilus sp. HI0128]KZZ80059.1 hypothetical protein A3766_09475 [Oleiphilus sp. HI0132]